MAKRMILMFVVMLALLSSLGFMKFRQISSAVQAASHFQPPPEAVTSIVAHQETWPATMGVIGTMEAVHGVTVSADLPGTVDKISFESGQYVHEGDVLVELDTRQERAQLAALEAQRDLARTNFTRMKQLLDAGGISRADFDASVAQQKQTEANVAEIRATIERKTIRAPFTGILGIRKVNLGQYLSAGNEVVSLQSLDPIYVNFSLPQQTAGQVHAGQGVRLTASDLPSVEFAGQVTAIDSIVDEATRNVQVQATLPNRGGKLHPGMFVQVALILGANRPVIALPASAITYAPYGDSVFVVSDLKDKDGHAYRGLRQQFVKLGSTRGDQVAIIAGIDPGEEVVTSGGFKLRPGAAVQVNNKIQPSNDPSPKVEER